MREIFIIIIGFISAIFIGVGLAFLVEELWYFSKGLSLLLAGIVFGSAFVMEIYNK